MLKKIYYKELWNKHFRASFIEENKAMNISKFDEEFMIIKAESMQSANVYSVVQTTIQEIYPRYYTDEVVLFFIELHSVEAISEDISKGMVYVLMCGGTIAATGTIDGNHINRVYVLPEYRGRGVGKRLMDYLEDIISKSYTEIWVDASLPAGGFYQMRGYVTKDHQEYPLENDKILAYEVMCKSVN